MEVTRTSNAEHVLTCPHHVGTVVVSLPEPISDSVGWVDLRYVNGLYVLECKSTGCVFYSLLGSFLFTYIPLCTIALMDTVALSSCGPINHQ